MASKNKIYLNSLLCIASLTAVFILFLSIKNSMDDLRKRFAYEQRLSRIISNISNITNTLVKIIISSPAPDTEVYISGVKSEDALINKTINTIPDQKSIADKYRQFSGLTYQIINSSKKNNKPEALFYFKEKLMPLYLEIQESVSVIFDKNNSVYLKNSRKLIFYMLLIIIIPILTIIAAFFINAPYNKQVIAANIPIVNSQDNGASAKIKAKDEEMENFVRSVSHDVKSPLTTIEMFSEVLERDMFQDPKKALNELERIKISIQRLRKLIDNLSEYSLISVSEYQKETIDINSILKEAVSAFTVAGVKPDNSISGCSIYPLKDEGAKAFLNHIANTVAGDRLRIYQVISELINNAVKFKGINPLQLKIDGFEDNGFMHLRVSDNGMGIDQRFHNKVFDMCLRLVSKDQVEGSGVGLSIVKKIISKHNGKIWVESEGVGKGSTFHILLPKN